MSKSKSSKSPKYIFTLENLNLSIIHLKYNIDVGEIYSMVVDNPLDTTKLTELYKTNKNTHDIISFLDEAKRPRSCQVSMIDFTSKKEVNLLRYHCFWCKSPFDTRPIGCPTKYVPNQIIKTYHSYISKDTYTIKENVTVDKMNNLDNEQFIPTQKGEYYETDGVFCSFNCCQSYINDNKHNRLYDNSHMLLTKLYNDIMDTKTVVISPAPNWRTLEHYGGHLNILQFRDSFNKVDYEYHGYNKEIPNFLALGMLFETKIKF